MSLYDAALGKRATVFFAMVAVFLLGLSAYNSLPRERFPDIEIPIAVVIVPYPGAAPAEVESQIVTPLERELSGVDDLKTMTSVAQEGQGLVQLEFNVGTDIDVALNKIRDQVDIAEVDFPTDAEEPLVQEVSFSSFPVIQVHLHGAVGVVGLQRIAEDLQDELEAIPGVLEAALVGGLEREVEVAVDPAALRLYGLSLDDVIDAVRDENVSIPGGDLDLGDATYAVRVPGEVDDPLAVADFVVSAEGGRPVFVRDVATVRYGFEDRRSFARIDGAPSVALNVQKRSGINIIQVNDRVKEVTLAAAANWPAGIQATFLGDGSRDVRLQVADLENSILSGLALVIVVLMFALGFRNALFVALAIPFSMLLTFMALQASGNTLNTVVLFALVLAVGMLVDNAVVVIENIYRHLEDGLPRLEAASVGTREVAAAITVSTLTTLAAFAPLLFWPGIIGDFMSYLPRTVSFALAASLLVAFTINPVVCATFMPPRGKRGERGATTLDRLGGRALRFYEGSLAWSLDHKAVVVLGTVTVFFVVVFAFGMFSAGVEFFPDTEPNQIFVDIELPPGTRLEKSDSLMQQ
ncbi:MAG: efflux RND transporter permease subunit, partial [Acidobacteriota bacterium]